MVRASGFAMGVEGSGLSGLGHWGSSSWGLGFGILASHVCCRGWAFGKVGIGINPNPTPLNPEA